MAIVALVIAFIAFVSAFLAYFRIMKISDDIKLQEENIKLQEETIDEFLSSYNETGAKMVETIASSQEREMRILREVSKLKTVLYREICNKYGYTEEELEKSVE